MKKLLITLAMITIWCNVSYALTTCAKTGTYIGILKKNVSGSSTDTYASTKEWRVTYSYKTITGQAACNDISGTYATPKTNLYTSASDTGIYCWCKMGPASHYNTTTGITSYWVYLQSYADAPTCASLCTSACATAMSSDSTFRAGVFESVW